MTCGPQSLPSQFSPLRRRPLAAACKKSPPLSAARGRSPPLSAPRGRSPPLSAARGRSRNPAVASSVIQPPQLLTGSPHLVLPPHFLHSRAPLLQGRGHGLALREAVEVFGLNGRLHLSVKDCRSRQRRPGLLSSAGARGRAAPAAAPPPARAAPAAAPPPARAAPAAAPPPAQAAPAAARRFRCASTAFSASAVRGWALDELRVHLLGGHRFRSEALPQRFELLLEAHFSTAAATSMTTTTTTTTTTMTMYEEDLALGLDHFLHGEPILLLSSLQEMPVSFSCWMDFPSAFSCFSGVLPPEAFLPLRLLPYQLPLQLHLGTLSSLLLRASPLLPLAASLLPRFLLLTGGFGALLGFFPAPYPLPQPLRQLFRQPLPLPPRSHQAASGRRPLAREAQA